MATVLLLHAVRGLQDYERAAAERLRAAGHAVVLPDLFDGAGAATLEEGMALKERVGWEAAVARAEQPPRPFRPTAVLGGFSWGAAVAAEICGPAAPRPPASCFCTESVVDPADRAARDPVQLHLAEPDPFEEEWVTWLARHSGGAGLAPQLWRYPGAGHLFTDEAIEDHDPAAAALLWSRARDFLANL